MITPEDFQRALDELNRARRDNDDLRRMNASFLKQLQEARMQNEDMLATLRQLYDRIRAQQQELKL